MNKQVEEIRVEIERLKDEIHCGGHKSAQEHSCDACIVDIYQNILSFIDSMQEEPVSENLEKAASNHSNNCTLYGYVARNIDGSLYLFEVEPKRIEDKWWDRDYHSTILDNEAFPELKWEDAPIFVRLVIIKKG